MPHFQKPWSGNTSGWDEDNYRVTVGAGQTVRVWLQLGDGLQVKMDDTGVATFVEKSPPFAQMRALEVTGVTDGKTTQLRALLSNGVDHSKPLAVVVTRKPLPGTRAGKLLFDDMDDAARAGIDEINPTSIAEGREYSGIVFEKGGRFGYSHPLRGEVDAAVPFANPPAGATLVATYHTHGAGFAHSSAAEGFSLQDRGFHNLRQVVGYLGTPKGKILRFDPGPKPANPGMAAFGGKSTELRSGKTY